MARSNCFGFASNTPNTAQGVRLQNKFTANKFTTYTSETVDATRNRSRPENKVDFNG